MPLKLYVWHNVLCDYTAGLAVALAENVNEARGMLVADGVFDNPSDLAAEPTEHPVDEPFYTYIYGGG